MPPKRPIPWDLRLVSYLFVLIGVLSGVDIVWRLLHDQSTLNVGVLGIFAGCGL